MAFFAKVFPEIVKDGRIYIAEPPLYRIDDKKDPFVLNKADYLNRYVKSVTKVYNVGSSHDGKIANVRWFNKKDLTEFLEVTSPYVEEIDMISNHYKVNEQLVEIILRYLSELPGEEPQDIVKHINVQEMMHRIGEKFPELYYDDNDHLIRGVIDGKYQLIEVNEPFVRRCMDLIDILRWIGMRGEEDIVVCAKKGTLTCEDGLLAALKLLDRQKMKILARFKGLGENEDEDIKTCIMDPNTRSLIRANFNDIKNDMEIFQMLRGKNKEDLDGRKRMMRECKIDKSLIDT